MREIGVARLGGALIAVSAAVAVLAPAPAPARAQGPVGLAVFLPVSSSDPGTYQSSADCTADAQADNSEVTGCTQTWNWEGTVTVTPDCVSDNGSGAPWCIHKKQKDGCRQGSQVLQGDGAGGRGRQPDRPELQETADLCQRPRSTAWLQASARSPGWRLR